MICDNMAEDKIAEITRKISDSENENITDLYRKLIEALADAEVYCPVENDEIMRFNDSMFISLSTSLEDFKEVFAESEFIKFKFPKLEEFIKRDDNGIFLNPGKNPYLMSLDFAQMAFNASKPRKQVTAGYDVKVRLNDFRPLTWRDIIIPENMTFMELDDALKTLWDFDGTHLSCFLIRKDDLIIIDDDLAGETMMGCDFDANTTTVAEIFDRYDRVTYWYDFGDDWQFDIEVKKKVDYDRDYITIKRFKGKYGPVEDCGGVYGLSEIVYYAEHPDEDDSDYYSQLVEYLPEFDQDIYQLYLEYKGYTRLMWHRDVYFRK